MSRPDDSGVLCFTRTLADLCAGGVPLVRALGLLVQMESLPGKVRKGAAEIADALESGSVLSAAFARSSALCFSGRYRAFIACAEETGSPAKTLSFLAEQLAEAAEARSRLIAACVYPAFVVAMAAVVSIAVQRTGGLMPAGLIGDAAGAALSGESAEIAAAGPRGGSGFVYGGLFLVTSIAALLVPVKKCLSADINTGLFSALAFLAESGVMMYRSLSCALLCVPRGSRQERTLVRIMDSMVQGCPVSVSFRESGACVRGGCFNQIVLVQLEIAEQTGTEASAFKSLAAWFREKAVRRRKLCLQCAEPALLCVVAVYLIIVLQQTVLPVLYGFSG